MDWCKELDTILGSNPTSTVERPVDTLVGVDSGLNPVDEVVDEVVGRVGGRCGAQGRVVWWCGELGLLFHSGGV